MPKDTPGESGKLKYIRVLLHGYFNLCLKCPDRQRYPDHFTSRSPEKIVKTVVFLSRLLALPEVSRQHGRCSNCEALSPDLSGRLAAPVSRCRISTVHTVAHCPARGCISMGPLMGHSWTFIMYLASCA